MSDTGISDILEQLRKNSPEETAQLEDLLRNELDKHDLSLKSLISCDRSQREEGGALSHFCDNDVRMGKFFLGCSCL